MITKGIFGSFRIWDGLTQQEVAPTRYTVGFNYIDSGTRGNRAEVHFLKDKSGLKYDISPDPRPGEDLVKLAELYSGQRLDAQGRLVPLEKSELRNRWNQLRNQYPDEFTVRPEAVMAWHVDRISSYSLEAILAWHVDRNEYYSLNRNAPEIGLHRKWLADQMMAINWHEDPNVRESDANFRSLERLKAMAQFGRPEEATASAERLAAHASRAGKVLMECACINALAAGATTADPQAADRYGKRAVAFLQQALAANAIGHRYPPNEVDFTSLLPRADYQALMKEFSKNLNLPAFR